MNQILEYMKKRDRVLGELETELQNLTQYLWNLVPEKLDKFKLEKWGDVSGLKKNLVLAMSNYDSFKKVNEKNPQTSIFPLNILFIEINEKELKLCGFESLVDVWEKMSALVVAWKEVFLGHPEISMTEKKVSMYLYFNE